eukprot:CAMPEP_0175180088 /NCGR_PEP_ID=MMETSP0087-20121206/35877_1 /TAXON_ID=136419 /ORGANISM="Unknown Unknown, Strain D1" /LENGTH=196 /DNA_ID=CAMNT_0016472397 /DNA_START=12 /DNA_END=602 /DNA_ORIENTATION=+
MDVDRVIKFSSGYGTKDKALKAVQWAAKLLVATSYPGDTENGAKLLGLFKACVLHRKAFRFGQILGNLRTLNRLLTEVNADGAAKWGVKVAQQLFWIGYFLCDHIVWLGEIKFVKIDVPYWKLKSFQMFFGAVSCATYLSTTAPGSKTSPKFALQSAKLVCDIINVGKLAQVNNCTDFQMSLAGLISALIHCYTLY